MLGFVLTCRSLEHQRNYGTSDSSLTLAVLCTVTSQYDNEQPQL